MEFKPVMKTPPKLMDARIFRTGPWPQRDMLEIPFEDRLTYVPSRKHFLSSISRISSEVERAHPRIQNHVEKTLKPLGKKVLTIVNYDNFNILPSSWRNMPRW